jgi:hypothetical protein
MNAGDFVDNPSNLDQQVQDAKVKYIQAAAALRQQVEEAKQGYHQAKDENRQTAQEEYIKNLNALNSLLAAGGAPKQFESAAPNSKQVSTEDER